MRTYASISPSVFLADQALTGTLKLFTMGHSDAIDK